MKKIVFLVALVFATISFHGQNKENKWVIGVSGSLVNFGDDGKVSNIQEQFNIQVPKINVARYIFKGLVLDAGITYGVLSEIDGFFSNSFDYFSIDGNLRYDFNLSDENLVPYIAIGGSIIGAPSTISGSKASPTTNITFGGTFWISHHWGINAQATYKYSKDDIESMKSHTQLSAGLVYSLSPRVLLYRIWDGRRN